MSVTSEVSHNHIIIVALSLLVGFLNTYAYCCIGIKLLTSMKATDMQEAMALSHRRDIVDIYSNSWGEPDTGFLVGGPRPMGKLALQRGTSEVRDEL